MFWKLAAAIIALGLFACALLAMRQGRLQAAHEMAQTQLRIRALDEKLYLLRAQIAERVTPQQVRELASDVGPLHPIVTKVESGEARPVHGPATFSPVPPPWWNDDQPERADRGSAAPGIAMSERGDE